MVCYGPGWRRDGLCVETCWRCSGMNDHVVAAIKAPSTNIQHREKPQTSNPKIHGNFKSQASIQRFGNDIWNLIFDHSLKFDEWSLKFFWMWVPSPQLGLGKA